MTGNTLEALDALVRFGLPRVKQHGRSWSFPVILTRRAVWLVLSACLAGLISVGWCLWTAHLSGIDVVSTIEEGCAVSLLPLMALGVGALAVHATTARGALAEGEVSPENFGDVTFTLDRSLVLRSVSPAFSGMFGAPAASVIGHTALELVHPADCAALSQLLDAVIAGQERAESLHRCRNAQGHWLWVEVDLRLVRHPSTARPEAILGVARDVTRWKQSEIRLEAANRRLATLALEDSLTGLANRRRFDEALDQEFRRAMRSASPLSLLMIDADHFKRFNDVHGHQAGDVCLRAIARTLQAQTHRPGDVVARFGGEEFVVLLPSTGPRGAVIMAERIRAAVEAELAVAAGGGTGQITVSVGVASTTPRPEQDSAAALVHDADRALYAAKAAGRNRVCSAVPEIRQNFGAALARAAG